MADEQESKPAAPAPAAPAAPKVDPLAEPVASPALERLRERHAELIEDVRFWAGVPIVRVRRDEVVEVLRFLRDDERCRFDHLATLFATHFPDRAEAPLEVTYCLFSWPTRQELIVKVVTPEGEQVPSVTGVYPSANWNEREAYDMVGVEFSGHPDPTRILLPDDWQGHPLRREYPLEGNPGDHKTYRKE
ncbi:MAG: NADH-quinone oxidoreductase subunit C [Acidobacteria bacterium]|nr:NADH-quinone oxidoreductase subunit C [Acidobacteriota bacterium]